MHLNPKLYDISVEQKSLREGFGEALVRAGEVDNKVVAVSADLKDSTRLDLFAEKFPTRFFEVGVAEQNLAAMASGLAATGKIPFIASYAVFSPGRNWEQIRTTICYNNQPVKIVGSHAGLGTGPDGGSHQALEDIALMRVLPRMTVVVPADYWEARKATLAIAQTDTPAYLRLVREKYPVITTPDSPFEIGKANILIDQSKPVVAIVACGPLVYQALLAEKKLAKEGIEVMVVNNHTIKPLDRETILQVAKKAGRIITVEDHQQAGGLGSTIAELLSQEFPTSMKIMGVNDRFGQSGSPAELVEHYGLGVDDIVKAVKEILNK
ncbi:MAG: transketolase C-terminal domain-containing protein [Candidatus Paceibacterota bacterium]|jgi:transketolase